MGGSMVWTDEEAQYLRALLAWRPSKADGEQYMAIDTRKPAGEFRFLVIGASGCGKTSILTRIAEDTPLGEDEYPSPEYERGCRRIIQIEEDVYFIDALELRSEHLWDEPYLRQAIGITEAAILVYDVTARESFDLMGPVVDVIRDALGAREYGLTLVGNKSDCEEGRQVSWAEGHRLAASFRIRCSFLETSAKRGENVDRVFPQLGKDVLKLRWLMRQRKEEEERLAVADNEDDDGDIIHIPVKRRARWRSWTRPWLHKRLDGRKASTA